MKYNLFFFTVNVVMGFSLVGMESPDTFLQSKEKSEIKPKPIIQNVLEVPVLMKLALEKRKEQKLSEAVIYYNMFHYRLLQDVACCRNLSKEKLCRKLEKKFSQIDNEPYAKFINKADEKLISQISLGALEWAAAMNRTKKLPAAKWLLEFQPTVEFYPENQWQEKRNEALENIRMEFEDFSI
ncbi:MAG TPA: hypothetical protein VHO47_00090 [Candidatus Babeliales bacterium]|nr:hypothetical protein [Candidatus Babeliales bacterium]